MDLASIASHIHNWVLLLLWLHPFILSGVISPLISSSILGTYQSGEALFQCPIILPSHTVHGVLKASQAYAPTSNAIEAEVERFYENLQDHLELTSQKDVLFIIEDWNAKVGSQETPGGTGKFGLGVQNETGQRLKSFAKRTHWS